MPSSVSGTGFHLLKVDRVRDDAVEPRKILDQVVVAKHDVGPAPECSEMLGHDRLVAILLPGGTSVYAFQ